jgi:hypothetical protein
MRIWHKIPTILKLILVFWKEMTAINKLITLSSQWQDSFKEIQCYQDDQVNSVIQKLLNDKTLTGFITQLFTAPHSQLKLDLKSLSSIHSVESLQSWVEENIFPFISKSYTSFSISGLDTLESSKAYIFISNHRDIVMDPLLLNKALREASFSTANCAIGDNLLQHPSANDLALLNRCFKIFRSIKSPRAILKAMKTQSEYIKYLHFTKKENVWIAQKEGRAKDNIDLTNPALIKMLGLARPKDLEISDYLSRLNIVPVSFSYEWDPCDIDKAIELAAQNENADYTKDKLDDFIATQKGLSGNKGQIHMHFGAVISNDDDNKLEHKLVANKIDQSIKSNYRLYPVNYAAHKKIHNTCPDHAPYSKQEINQAGKLLEQHLEHVNEQISKRVYQAYAQMLQ